MPTNASGVHSLPSGYFVESGDTILPSQHNPPFEDVSQGLTDRLMRDGRAPMTGSLAMGGNRITGLGAATGGNDAVRFSQMNSAIYAAALAIAGPALAGRTASGTGSVSAIALGAGLGFSSDQVVIRMQDFALAGAADFDRIVVMNSGTNTHLRTGLDSLRTAISAVPTSRSIAAGAGLSGGGALTANVSLAFNASGLPGVSSDFDRVLVASQAGANNAGARVSLETFTNSLPMASLMSRIAAASAGGVGTYVWAWRTGSTAFGATYAGSEILVGETTRASDNVLTMGNSGSPLSGTWRAMSQGRSTAHANGSPVLFMRVS